MRRYFLTAFLIVLVAGCASKPVQMSSYSEGTWDARALIKDKAHSRSFIVILDFFAVRGEGIRVDATSTLGQHVASLVATNTEARFYTSENKKFYVGNPGPDVFKPILSIPMNPHWMEDILFDQPIVGENWICSNGTDKLVSECHSDELNLMVKWERKGAARSVTITHPKAEIQIGFRSFKPKVELRDKIFDLQMPAGYQRFKIR